MFIYIPEALWCKEMCQLYVNTKIMMKVTGGACGYVR